MVVCLRKVHNAVEFAHFYSSCCYASCSRSDECRVFLTIVLLDSDDSPNQSLSPKVEYLTALNRVYHGIPFGKL